VKAMRKSIHLHFLQRWKSSQVIALLVFTALVVGVDRLTGDRLDVSFFYALAMMAVGWAAGPIAVVVAVGLAAAMHLWAAAVAGAEAPAGKIFWVELACKYQRELKRSDYQF